MSVLDKVSVSSEVSVGSEVGFGRNARFGLINTGFARVTKINGHGHITLDNGKVFDKRGNERGTNYGVSLINADALRRQLAWKEEQRTTTEKVKELQRKVADLFGYNSQASVSPDEKASLLALVNSL